MEGGAPGGSNLRRLQPAATCRRRRGLGQTHLLRSRESYRWAYCAEGTFQDAAEAPEGCCQNQSRCWRSGAGTCCVWAVGRGTGQQHGDAAFVGSDFVHLRVQVSAVFTANSRFKHAFGGRRQACPPSLEAGPQHHLALTHTPRKSRQWACPALPSPC